MPSKTEEYLALAQRTANGLTRYWESWTDYLTTASRLYKYPFADQLMIYAQRPDATACADFDIWNTRIYHEMKLTPAMVKSIRTSAVSASGTTLKPRRSRLPLCRTRTDAWKPARSARPGVATTTLSCRAESGFHSPAGMR